MANINCQADYEAYLCDIPSEWRKQIATLMCKVTNDKYTLTCPDVKACETLTSLSPFTVDGSEVSIQYKDEKGITVVRSFDINDAITGGFEDPLTFSIGLTRTIDTVTANISTGVLGGQFIYGGTAASEDLGISSTTNATKGNINIGASSTYDEANDRLGIRTLTPTQELSISEKLWLYTDFVSGTQARIQSSAGMTLTLMGGGASGIHLIPNAYGSTPNIRVEEDITGNNPLLSFVNSGAVTQYLVGIDNVTDLFYIRPYSGGGGERITIGDDLGDFNGNYLEVNDVNSTIINSSVAGKYRFDNVAEYADNTAALAGGLVAGMIYRTGDLMKIVH